MSRQSVRKSSPMGLPPGILDRMRAVAGVHTREAEKDFGPMATGVNPSVALQGG